MVQMEDVTTLSARSTLFGLPPQGLETGAVEGLLSYLVRLARAHCVSPRKLVLHILGPANLELATIFRHHSFMLQAHSVNGAGTHASLFAKTLEELTQVKGLRNLTLLPWSPIVSSRSQKLIMRNARWCAECLSSWKQEGLEIYRPLCWSIGLYRVCSNHLTPLQDRCRHCGKPQPCLPIKPSMGTCDTCGGWLGVSTEFPRAADDEELWANALIEDLVTHNYAASASLTRANLEHTLKAIVIRFGGGEKKACCDRLGLPAHTLSSWLKKGANPDFLLWMRLCRAASVTPSDFLNTQTEPFQLSPPAKDYFRRESPPSTYPYGPRKIISPADRPAIEKQLERIAQDPNDTRPFRQVAKSLGFGVGALKHWFEPKVAEIVAKSSEGRRQRTQQRIELGKRMVIEITNMVIDSGRYPARNVVNHLLLERGFSLMEEEWHQAYLRTKTQRLSENDNKKGGSQ